MRPWRSAKGTWFFSLSIKRLSTTQKIPPRWRSRFAPEGMHILYDVQGGADVFSVYQNTINYPRNPLSIQKITLTIRARGNTWGNARDQLGAKGSYLIQYRPNIVLESWLQHVIRKQARCDKNIIFIIPLAYTLLLVIIQIFNYFILIWFIDS